MALWERAALGKWQVCYIRRFFVAKLGGTCPFCECHNLLLTPSEKTIMLPSFKGNMSLRVRIPSIQHIFMWQQHTQIHPKSFYTIPKACWLVTFIYQTIMFGLLVFLKDWPCLVLKWS